MYTCSAQYALDESSSSQPIYPPLNQINLLIQPVCIDFPWYESYDMIWFEGSCNGLICLSSYCEILSLWNPATREARKLPNSGTVLDFKYYIINYGFGYDELHDDYKVVEYLNFERVEGTPTLDIQIKVYSLRAKSWKTLSNWPAAGRAFGGPGQFLNGAIYWSVLEEGGQIKWVIVSYDLSTDTFSVLHLHDLDYKEDVNVEVKVLRGCLAVCCERNTHMDIWLMKECSCVWTKVATIPFFVDLRHFEFIRPRPLFLSMDGKMLVNYRTNLSLYDPNDPNYTHNFDCIIDLEAIGYFESLVSPNYHSTEMAPQTTYRDISSPLLLE